MSTWLHVLVTDEIVPTGCGTQTSQHGKKDHEAKCPATQC